MRAFRPHAQYIILILILTCVITSGCAVLTRSQVKEVEKFAKASESYSDLPGILAQSYGELLCNSKLLVISRKDFGQFDVNGRIDTTEANDAWETVQDAYKDQIDFEAAGKRMDSALSVLKIYSDLLTALVSEDSTDSLSDSTERLSKSLDSATQEYSERYRPADPMNKVGGTIAMAVRSAGGLFIRIKQALILKTTLKEADPLIAKLMAEVKQIASEKLKPSLLNYENNYLQNDFKSLANNKKEVSISTVSFVYDNLYKTRQSIILADRVTNAAETYRKAHAALVENTRTRKTLKEAIRQIEAFSAEINAANKVKKKVEK